MISCLSPSARAARQRVSVCEREGSIREDARVARARSALKRTIDVLEFDQVVDDAEPLGDAHRASPSTRRILRDLGLPEAAAHVLTRCDIFCDT